MRAFEPLRAPRQPRRLSLHRPLPSRPEVPIVSSNLPVEKNVFYLPPPPNIVHDHVAPASCPLIDGDTDVWHVPAEVPGD